ncbi:glycosyltransferase family 2 protein [Bowmanella denitrificans]|uniref:glycosyltransferase family 2 protein n=1 Tax=Bowmanella denitrificans TaxID=366582 RepID=UPI000C9C84EF|nr:glycosyltransferase family 2 protein [Bowmanella denitrificans]
MIYTTTDIAVIIPVYNSAAFLEDTLHALFRQRELPGEVIIVNDGSVDGSEQVIRNSPYAADITYLEIPNSGPGAARNHGLAHTSKPWVAFLDADDQWSDWHKLQMQIELANLHPDAVLIDSFAEVDWGGELPLVVQRIKQGRVFEQFLHHNVVNATSSVLAKTIAVRQVGGFDEDLRFGEDRLLWARLAKIGEVHTLQEVTVRKVNHNANLTAHGYRNYYYRLLCVQRLLEMASLNQGQTHQIWYENMQEFLREAFKANDVRGYRKLFRRTMQLSGGRGRLSRYALINLYGSLFGQFTPLNQMA